MRGLDAAYTPSCGSHDERMVPAELLDLRRGLGYEDDEVADVGSSPLTVHTSQIKNQDTGNRIQLSLLPLLSDMVCIAAFAHNLR